MKPISKSAISGSAILLLAIGFIWWKSNERPAGSGSDTASALSGAPSRQGARARDTAAPDPSGSRAGARHDRPADAAADAESTASAARPPAPLAPPVWQMASSGQSATARVIVDGASHQLTPNQLGEFQRVYVKLGASVPVTVRYPDAKPGDKIIAAMQDGGTLDGKDTAAQFSVDASGKISFSADTREEGGIHRVLLTKGSDRKTLEIWGGSESPLKSEVQ